MSNLIVVSNVTKDHKPKGKLASAFTKGWNTAAPKGATGGDKIQEAALVVSTHVATGLGMAAGATANLVRSVFRNK